MELQEILDSLDRDTGRYPRAAVTEAIARRDEIVPALLATLEDVARDPVPYTSEMRWIHVFAMYLLAQFRESTFSTGARGHLACAISLSVKLSPSFRALVSANMDSRLFAVTGADRKSDV